MRLWRIPAVLEVDPQILHPNCVVEVSLFSNKQGSAQRAFLVHDRGRRDNTYTLLARGGSWLRAAELIPGPFKQSSCGVGVAQASSRRLFLLAF